MDINEQLRTAGLKESEIQIYLHVLSHPAANPPAIAKATGIARPNCYKILANLMSKSLIKEQTQGKRKVYLAADPSVLVHSMQLRTEALTRLLPDLRAMFSAAKNKPSIRFFEGAEQMKEIFYEMLEAKEVLGVASTKQLYAALSPEFFQSYIKQMQEKKIVLRDILTKNSVPTSAPTPIGILKGLYEYRELPESVPDVPVDILIWDAKVAFLSVENPLFGTLIENPAIAKMLRVMFELSWQKLTV